MTDNHTHEAGWNSVAERRSPPDALGLAEPIIFADQADLEAKSRRKTTIALIASLAVGAIIGAFVMNAFGTQSGSWLGALTVSGSLLFFLPCLLMFGMMFMMMGKRGE